MSIHNLIKSTLLLFTLFAAVGITAGFSPMTDEPVNDPAPAMAKAEAEALGTWISNNGNEKFEIYRKGDKFCGRIIWTKHDEKTGMELLDEHNPDPEKREQPIVGLEILYDFVYRGNGVYAHGRVYDPGSGKTYKCKIKVDGNTAKVRGYILMPLLGRTETAHRVFDSAGR
jgi:uncharacterized protein (DUF2147 family)